MSTSRKTASHAFDVAAQFAFTVAGRGLFLVLQIYLARQLGPTDFGLYSMGWTVVGLITTMTLVGMPQAAIRFEVGGRGALFAQPMLTATAVGLAAALATLLAADPIARVVFNEPAAAGVIRAFAPTVVFGGLATVMVSALRVTGAVFMSALAGTVVTAAGLLLTVAVFAGGASPAAAAAVQSVAAALGVGLLAGLLWREPTVSRAPPWRTLLRFGMITAVIHGSNVLNIMADRLLVGMLLDAAAVGVYQVASQLVMVVIVLRTAVTAVFEARLPKQWVDGRPPDVTRDYFAATRILLHASAPGLVVLSLTSGGLVELLFGANYSAATAPAVVLVLGQMLVTLTGPSLTALHMTGAEKLVLWATFGSLLLNLAGNVALIPVLGPTGAAAASMVANLAVHALCLAVLIRTGRLRFSVDHLRDIVLATAICALACVAVAQVAGAFSLGALILMLVVAYATYVAVVAVTCTVDDEMLASARGLAARALRRLGQP